MNEPLAYLVRPTKLEEMYGQKHICGSNGIISKIIASKKVPNLILYGPSGTGKTTLASIIAASTDKKLYKLNATTASTKDIKEIIDDINKIESASGILLYLDEIQYFTKKQQQSLLEFIESGDITLIASTTENPYFYIYNAIISRCTVLEFYPLTNKEVTLALNRALTKYEEMTGNKVEVEKGLCEYLASCSGGDVRKAINALEVLISGSDYFDKAYHLTLAEASSLSLSPIHYDKDGDEHYDLLSAFQKSIRGSDPDAAIFYLGKLLASKDLISPCRRLLVIASEDIGLAYPNASVITKSLVDSALQLGLPEARIPLAEAVIFLATAPKSNSAAGAIDKALDDISKGMGKNIPGHLRDGHYSGANKLNHAIGYKYPHAFPNHYVEQQYLPDDLTYRVYYEYGSNKNEQLTRSYWENIKHKK